jgi:hypothetical protein
VIRGLGAACLFGTNNCSPSFSCDVRFSFFASCKLQLLYRTWLTKLLLLCWKQISFLGSLFCFRGRDNCFCTPSSLSFLNRNHEKTLPSLQGHKHMNYKLANLRIMWLNWISGLDTKLYCCLWDNMLPGVPCMSIWQAQFPKWSCMTHVLTFIFALNLWGLECSAELTLQVQPTHIGYVAFSSLPDLPVHFHFNIWYDSRSPCSFQHLVRVEYVLH